MITSLAPNEIFVFGANLAGFHGAGAAGYAFKGSAANDWRECPRCLDAIEATDRRHRGLPYNKEALIGKWAEFGRTGLQKGREGRSFGIVTTERPGIRGIVSDLFLAQGLGRLLWTAHDIPEMIFRCADFGLSRAHGGFSWWSPEELRQLWARVVGKEETPTNLIGPSWMTQCPSWEQEVRGFWPCPSDTPSNTQNKKQK